MAKETIIVAPREVQEVMLEHFEKSNTIAPIHLMTKEDLFKKVFFSLHPLAVYKASEFLKLKPSIIKDRLEFLYYIDDTKHYDHPQLVALQALKKYLVEHDLCEVFTGKDDFFHSKTIEVHGYIREGLLKHALSTLEKSNPVTIINSQTPQNVVTLEAYSTREEEVLQTLSLMRQLHEEKKIPYNDMTVMPLDEIGTRLVKTYADSFNIPINLETRKPLIAYSDVQMFLKQLDVSQKGPLYKQFNDTLNKVYFTHEGVRLKLIEVLNRFVRFDVKKFSRSYLEDALKTTFVRLTTLKDAVEIGSMQSIPRHKAAYLFFLHAEEGRFPVFKNEDDYLDKQTKQIIHAPTASDVNASREAELRALIGRFSHVYISYALQCANESLYKADTLKRIEQDFVVVPLKNEALHKQPYSLLLDQILSKEALEAFTMFNTHSEYLQYVPQFEALYRPYENTFTGLKETTLERLLPKMKTLSYTRLNTAFECRFRFYVEHLLAVDKKDFSLSIDFGNFFHAIFERYLDSETAVDEAVLSRELELFCEEKKYTEKEAFYLRSSLPLLCDVFNIVDEHHQASQYQVSHIELDVSKVYERKQTTTLVGKIDKVMHDVDRQEQIVLVDYKTGKPTLSLTKTWAEIPSQLLVYALLISETLDETIRINGLYEQTIFPKRFNQEKGKSYQEVLRDYVKLQGITHEDVDSYLRFDHNASTSAMVKGVRITNQGRFHGQTKTYKTKTLAKLLQRVDEMIEQMIDKLQTGDFVINPKEINGKNVSCMYCNMRDICFKSYSDHERINTPKDADILKALEEDEA